MEPSVSTGVPLGRLTPRLLLDACLDYVKLDLCTWPTGSFP